MSVDALCALSYDTAKEMGVFFREHSEEDVIVVDKEYLEYINPRIELRKNISSELNRRCFNGSKS